LVTGAGLFSGYDTNIYRSPRKLEKGGEFFGGLVFLRADNRFGEKQRLLTKLTWEQIRYPGHSNANLDRGRLTTWYTRPLTDNTSFELDLGITYKNDDATTITGDKYDRDFGYWRYAADGLFVWDMSKEHQFKVGGGYTFKDYDETSGLNSLDWDEWTLEARYRYRFAKSHYLRLWYSLSERKYDEELAGLRDGIELPSNPKEKHYYHRAKVWYSVPIADNLDLDLKYDYKIKDDRFKDYESYDSHEIEAGIQLEVNEKTQIEMEVEYEIKDFDNYLGDNGHKLEYTKWNLGVGARYKLWDSGWIFSRLNYYLRDTNRSWDTVYRDYKGLVCSGGISVFF
jgi:hypothetical protein